LCGLGGEYVSRQLFRQIVVPEARQTNDEPSVRAKQVPALLDELSGTRIGGTQAA
jgi:hypothetical protein